MDNDGKHELVSVDRGGRRVSIDALAGNDLDALASFTNEYMNGDYTGGGVFMMLILQILTMMVIMKSG